MSIFAFTHRPSDQAFIQVRVWLAHLPISGKLPPRPLAVMPISSRVVKPELRAWHDDLIQKLIDRDIHVISYSVDGAQIERSISHDIHNEAFASGQLRTWHFDHPGRVGQLVLETPLLVAGRPWVMGTDGKHAKKNGRNAATSGARVLSMGEHLVHYGQLVALAESKDSPLLKADIIGVDKQDDRAAARLFSSATIEQIAKTQPDAIGLAIYLYIIGGMIDAQQNRAIVHDERMLLLWRARFFFEGWRAFIVRHPAYDVNTHFVSREFYDIVTIFHNSMLSLILTYRDQYSHLPLMPWLHSTEMNEHFFGVGRGILLAFYFVQFLQMVWKIILFMTSDITRVKINQESASVKKAGYHIFWTDTRGLDIENLCTYPSNAECDSTISTAYAESASLLEICGMGGQPSSSEQVRAALRSPPDTMSSEDYTEPEPDSLMSHEEAERLEELLRTDARDEDYAGRKHETDIVNAGIAAASLYMADTEALCVHSSTSNGGTMLTV
jgi:hypothetical protein